LTLLLGVFTEAVRPAFAAMMVDVVPDQDRVRAYSLNYWAINLGFALSAVGAGLAAKANYLLLFVVDAGSTLITALIGLIFLAETKPAGSGPRSSTGSMAAVLRDRTFLIYTLITLGAITVMMQHLSTLPIAMTADGFSPATYGWVIAVNGLLIVLGQLFVPRLINGFDRSRTLALASLIIGVGFGLVAVADAAWFFALTVVIWTLGEMLHSPSNAATVAALSPLHLRGRYQGVNALSWSAGTALAPILGGLTQEHLGETALWVGCFVVCGLAAVGHLITGPSRERRITRLEAEAATTATPEAPPALPPTVAEPVADNPVQNR
jgi:MFS family permease